MHFNADRSKDRPAKSTRAQREKEESTETSVEDFSARRVGQGVSASSCSLIIQNSIASMATTGRCDDGPDESIVSAACAKEAAIQSR